MKRLVSRGWPVLALCCALCGVGAADAHAAEAVTVVNGEPIPQSRLDIAVTMRLSAAGRGDTADSDLLEQLRSEVLDQLIAMELLWQEARARGVIVSDAEIDEVVEARRAQFEDDAEFVRKLGDLGLTEATYRDRLRRTLSINAMVTAEKHQVEVSPEEIQRFYEAERERLRYPRQVRARHILIKLDQGADGSTEAAAREKITALLARARAGEDFSELASEYSEGPTRERGGDLGFFGVGQTVPAFERAAFALAQPGDLSDVVRTPFGLHVIRLEERRGGEIVSFEEVKTRIHDKLYERKAAGRIEALTSELREKATIKVRGAD